MKKATNLNQQIYILKDSPGRDSGVKEFKCV